MLLFIIVVLSGCFLASLEALLRHRKSTEPGGSEVATIVFIFILVFTLCCASFGLGVGRPTGPDSLQNALQTGGIYEIWSARKEGNNLLVLMRQNAEQSFCYYQIDDWGDRPEPVLGYVRATRMGGGGFYFQPLRGVALAETRPSR